MNKNDMKHYSIWARSKRASRPRIVAKVMAYDAHEAIIKVWGNEELDPKFVENWWLCAVTEDDSPLEDYGKLA